MAAVHERQLVVIHPSATQFKKMNAQQISHSFQLASQRHAAPGADVNHALKTLASIPISLHCRQGDDVGGFENSSGALGNRLAVTGNHLGKAPPSPQEDLREILRSLIIWMRGRQNVH